MGSKTRPARSAKDAVIIREPIALNIVSGKSRQDQIAETCEISFHVKLNESPLVKKDVPISLQKAGSYYHILVLASIVGKLTFTQSEMIEACASSE